MVKISAVIITKNEEQNIVRCLQSLQNVVDEVVVVDSLSTDKTKDICLRYGARFIEQEWLGYGEQKNVGNRKASYDYILSLDADEMLSAELQKAILEIKESWKYDAYSFNRLNMYCEKPIRHCGWYPDKRIRLWDRRKGEWDKAEVHEQLQLAADTTVTHIGKDIIHFSYVSISDHIERIRQYSSLWVEKAVKRNKKVSFFKLLITMPWRFTVSYGLRLGFLDGYSGLMVSSISAYSAYVNYSKLYYYKQTRKRLRFDEKSFSDAESHQGETISFTIHIKTSSAASLALCLTGIQANSCYKHKIALSGAAVESIEQLRLDYPSLTIDAEGQAKDTAARSVFIDDSLFVSERWDYLLCKEVGIL